MTRHKLFAVLVTLHLLADLYVACLTNRRLSEVRLGIVWSIFFAQVILASIWLAFGSGKLAIRGTLSIMLVTFATASQVFALIQDDAPRHFIPVTICAAAIQYCVVAGLFLVIRIVSGCQLGDEHQIHQPQQAEFQFGIAQLLLLTACAAVALGVMRNVFHNIDVQHTKTSAGVYGLLVASNVFIVLPILFAALAENYLMIGLLGSLLYTIGVTVVEVTIFELVISPTWSPDTFFWCLNTLQFCWISFSLLLLRVDGFRLLRVRPNEGQPQIDSPRV